MLVPQSHSIRSACHSSQLSQLRSAFDAKRKWAKTQDWLTRSKMSFSDMRAKSANTLPGFAVDADGTSAKGYHVEEPTRHH
jgi:hypothetical protein